MAHRILKCVELRSYGPSQELDELLNHYLQIISENHRTDLGIDLEWDYPHTVDF